MPVGPHTLLTPWVSPEVHAHLSGALGPQVVLIPFPGRSVLERVASRWQGGPCQAHPCPSAAGCLQKKKNSWEKPQVLSQNPSLNISLVCSLGYLRDKHFPKVCAGWGRPGMVNPVNILLLDLPNFGKRLW